MSLSGVIAQFVPLFGAPIRSRHGGDGRRKRPLGVAQAIPSAQPQGILILSGRT